MTYAAVLSLTAAVLPGAADTPTRYPSEEFSTIGQRWRTPHTAWARPWAPGRLKVLAVAVSELAAREITELAQRLDMDVDTCLMAGSARMAMTGGGARYAARIEGTSPQEKRRELQVKLAGRHDVILLGNVRTAALPADLRYMLYRAVSNGTGLVVCHKQKADLEFLGLAPIDQAGAQWIGQGVPWRVVSYFHNARLQKRDGAIAIADVPGKLIETRRIGRGRVVAIKYGHPHDAARRGGRSLTPLNEGYHANGALQYDYALAAVARAVLWAARRPPNWRIVKPLASGLRVGAKKLPATHAIGLAGPAGKAFQGELHMRVRTWDGRPLAEQRWPVKITGGKWRLAK